jgi:hypothetical protein
VRAVSVHEISSQKEGYQCCVPVMIPTFVVQSRAAREKLLRGIPIIYKLCEWFCKGENFLDEFNGENDMIDNRIKVGLVAAVHPVMPVDDL